MIFLEERWIRLFEMTFIFMVTVSPLNRSKLVAIKVEKRHFRIGSIDRCENRTLERSYSVTKSTFQWMVFSIGIQQMSRVAQKECPNIRKELRYGLALAKMVSLEKLYCGRAKRWLTRTLSKFFFHMYYPTVYDCLAMISSINRTLQLFILTRNHKQDKNYLNALLIVESGQRIARTWIPGEA